jgi:hypothetical protein
VGTKFALNEEQTKLFSEFVRSTYLNVFRSHYMDFGVCGRSVSRKKTLDLGDYANLFKKMKQLDPANAKEYDDAAARFASKNPTFGRPTATSSITHRTTCSTTASVTTSLYVPYPSALAVQKAVTVKTCGVLT